MFYSRKLPTILSQKAIPKSKRKQLESTAKDAMTEADKMMIEQNKEKKELRNCLAVGINEVTRGLEKDEIKLVLVGLRRNF
jgi:ribosomal protein L7Ae-like RNA K-turn-binding protein